VGKRGKGIRAFLLKRMEMETALEKKAQIHAYY